MNKDDNKEKMLPVGLLPKYESKFESAQEDAVEAVSPVHAWSAVDATTWNVRRGPNFVPGQKSPSKSAMYEAFAMDTFYVPFKVNNITRFMNLKDTLRQHGVDGHCPIPQLIIINIMEPDYSPKLKQIDGQGYSVVVYAKLSQEMRRQLQLQDKGRLSPALRLWSHFAHDCQTNQSTRDRFKWIGRVMNLKHTAFNWSTKKLIKKYNSKPVLGKKDTAFHRSDDGQILTIDIDCHRFCFVAKKAWNHIKHIMDNVVYDLAWVIQGESDDELPERILTTVRLSKVAVGRHVQKLPQWAIKRCSKDQANEI